MVWTISQPQKLSAVQFTFWEPDSLDSTSFCTSASYSLLNVCLYQWNVIFSESLRHFSSNSDYSDHKYSLTSWSHTTHHYNREWKLSWEMISDNIDATSLSSVLCFEQSSSLPDIWAVNTLLSSDLSWVGWINNFCLQIKTS